jgi:glycosyltransferase involved in cell wall biosynthesis
MTRGRAPVSVLILTFNEERNLPTCLASVADWAEDVVVVDSGSTDQTTAIAKAHGARVVTHAFDTHARQWAWALADVPLTTDWVLALDADQQVTPELRHSIVAALGREAIAGYFVNRRQVFRGRWIRHGGYYPKYLLKLFRRSVVQLDSDDLVDHHFRINGRAARLGGDLIEDNRNEAEIFDWIAKHNRYARLQATEELARLRSPRDRGPWRGGDPDERTRRQKAVWARLPAYVRPLGYFLYRYVLRLGFLDGKQGFVFHFLQAWWYRLLVDINLDELRKAR